ncbi:MAG: MFS transporter [Alphaproteobacteria bacterium]|jgi:MFS family permease|nr:MFS transporter [Alphaproteobacteria bacterium]
MANAAERKRYLATMGVIGGGHAFSHFYLLVLPPLFPLLKQEFDVSYAALGLLISLINVVTGFAQVPAGFLIDRLGARALLMGGLALMGIAVAAIGLAPSYEVILVLVLAAGLGNAVIHPADYAILNRTVAPERIGRAFALHTFSGNLGFVAAPTVMIFLSSWLGWRPALMIAGLAVLAVIVALWRGRDLFAERTSLSAGGPGPAASADGGIRPLLTPTILGMFAFFVCIAVISSGIQSFSVTALVQLQGIGLPAANTVLSTFLVASALGILLGGPVADRTRRHGLVAVGCLLISGALLALVGGVGLPLAMLLLCFVLVGLLQGAIRPSRDMMVRAATPKGAEGRIFAFVSTGLNVGAAMTPVLFGYLIDLGHADTVFFAMALVLVLAVGTVVGTRRRRQPMPAAAD